MSESRVEELINKIKNGESIEDFQPISRSEAYLKAAITGGLFTDLPDPTSALDVLLRNLNNRNKELYAVKPYVVLNTRTISYQDFFRGNQRLDIVNNCDFGGSVNFIRAFHSATKLTEVPEGIPNKTGANYTSAFEKCTGITEFKTSANYSGNFNSMFSGCTSLKTVEMNHNKAYNLCYMCNGCTELTTFKYVDAISASSMSSMFTNCTNLTDLLIENIKVNLQIGSGTTWGHLLTRESLLNTIYELMNVGADRTLTVGSANLEKLANVYVRTIEITDSMRDSDKYIDQKHPFEVCESTDEGAMLITQYATLVKQWTIQ